METHHLQYLYHDGESYHFMNTETYEQIELSSEDLSGKEKFLLPNAKVEVEFHDTTPIGVSLPKTVDLKVVETAPGLKSATVTNTLKPATMETGLIVQVPEFIDADEVIRVDTESGDYVSRAKG